MELRKVSEAKELLIAEGAIPFDSFKNILPALKKSSIENHVLSVVELLEIAAAIRISRNFKIFLSKHADKYQLISAYHQQLYSEKLIEFHINDSLDSLGFVKDTASKELRQIRSSIIEAREALKRKLESILSQVSEKEFLQEDIITTRDGRQVIPVKTEYKHRVPGFIHSSSASGATVYIEPAESLELNNDLRELQLREQREIHKILSNLTRQVSEIREPLEKSFNTLVEMDVIFAKAKYSIETMGNAPVLSNTPVISFQDARHPILLRHSKREDVVPLNIELGKDFQTVVITGPNAGGKTVAMKTIGLLTLCALAGIHIPANPDSIIFPFNKIFVDIGDDQSIENDLSTFSSHLNSLHNILEEADDRSLVLIDEIGAGTDPSEGGALAMAVLYELTKRKTITVATTHHGMLKVFAHETPGISNASMEYDHRSLRSTYKLRSGVPGSSYAFELAERLGIPKDLLSFARAQVGEQKTKLEALIVDLENEIQKYQRQLRESGIEKKKLEELILSYEHKMTQLKRDLSIIRKKAADEAKEIVRQAQKKVEHSVKEIRESGAKKEVVISSRQVLKQLGEELHKISADEQVPPQTDENIQVGDFVQIRDGYESGEVVKIQGENAVVVTGSTKLKIALNKIRKTQLQPERNFDIAKTPALDAKNQIDLRGFLGDEAIALVEKFLDNAYAAGLHRVDIIHGKGSGALRKKIGEFIKQYPHAKSFRLGEWNEGGTGVTVVELD